MVTMIDPLIRKLERLSPLSDREKRLLDAVPLEVRRMGAQQELVRDDDPLSHCQLLLGGMVCRFKMVDGGRRQIMSFHMAGDILDLTSLMLGKLEHSIGTLTPVSVAVIPHAVMLDWMERVPRLSPLLWRDALVDAAVLGEWVINVAWRTAHARVAHLLCELVTRMRAAGLARDHACAVPVTQVELADATGLSVVHANRVLRELCDQGLVASRERSLVVRDWEGLKRAAEYDQGYLHPFASDGKAPAPTRKLV